MSAAENLFDGPAEVLTEHIGRTAEFRPVTDQPPQVRHLAAQVRHRRSQVSSLVELLAVGDDAWAEELVTRVRSWASEPLVPGQGEGG